MTLSNRINDTNAAPWVTEEIKKLEAERDALAAHVERLAGLWNAFCMCHEDEHGAYGARLNAAFGEAPETSLARLIAEKQEECIMDLTRHMRKSGYHDEADGVVIWVSEYLRSQAKESSNAQQ